MVLENTFIQIFVSALESIFHTSMLVIIVFQNMMLLAQWTSCLKDSHTNLQSYMGNGILYFGALSTLYTKTSAGNIKSICYKDSHTNYSNKVGISIWYFGISLRWYTKNDAASSMNQLFTPALHGLEELFSPVFESSPFTLCMCIARIRLVIHVNNK